MRHRQREAKRLKHEIRDTYRQYKPDTRNRDTDRNIKKMNTQKQIRDINIQKQRHRQTVTKTKMHRNSHKDTQIHQNKDKYTQK